MSELPEDEISRRVEDWARRRDAEVAAHWQGRRVGAFIVGELLGQGGMGVVVAAHRDDGAEVALKLIRPDLISAGLARRLQREHDMLSRLDHPGIARLHGLHLTQDGTPFLEMEKVDGVHFDLHAEALDLRARMEMLRDIACVVGHAHDQAIVHRDLKPGNVLVTADGRIKLLDFGIAKTIEEESLATMTATGERLLTPRYAAPEQLLGGRIAPATDVFSLGVILCELCIGFAPTARNTTLRQRTTEPTERSDARRTQRTGRIDGGDSYDTRAPLPTDTRLRRIAQRALQRVPELRYADANEFADELQRWLHGHAPHAGSTRDRLRQWWRDPERRRGRLITVIALLAIAALSVGGWQLWQAQTIDVGYGFVERDLAGLDAEARAQTRRALSLDAGGARETALGLIQNARQRAPDHPLLTYLGLTWGQASAEEAERQFQATNKVLQQRPNDYLQALLNADARASSSAATRRRLLASALQMRPDAWRLRYALAHGEIGSGKLGSALAQLQRIDIRDLRDRRAAQILSDRALLGDSAGARAALDGLPAERPAWRDWVMASIDFGEGRYDDAQQRFEKISTEAMEDSEPAIALWGRMGRVIALGQSKQWQALVALAGRELRRASDRGDDSTVLRTATLGAIGAHQLGDRERLVYFLDAARGSSDDPLFQIDAALTAAMLGEAPGDVDALIAALPDEADALAGLPPLLRAARALHAGDRDAVESELRRAEVEGVDDTRLAEVARWMRARHRGDAGYRAPASTLWFAPWCNWVPAWVQP